MVDKNEQSQNDYQKEHDFFVPFVCRARQQYFSSLNLSLIADNEKSGKQVKPSFQTRFLIEIISLTENGKTITQDLQTPEIFNNYFINVICSLCLKMSW